jgi:hypothetical protein
LLHRSTPFLPTSFNPNPCTPLKNPLSFHLLSENEGLCGQKMKRSLRAISKIETKSHQDNVLEASQSSLFFLSPECCYMNLSPGCKVGHVMIVMWNENERILGRMQLNITLFWHY